MGGRYRQSHEQKHSEQSQDHRKQCGDPGYDTCTELRVLEERGLQIKPDMVLLQYCPNDLAVTATVIPISEHFVRFYVGWEYTEISQMDFAFSGINLLDAQNLQFQRSENKMRASQTPVSACLSQLKSLSETEGFDLHVAAFPVFVDDLASEETVVEMQEGEFTASEAESEAAPYWKNSKSHTLRSEPYSKAIHWWRDEIMPRISGTLIEKARASSAVSWVPFSSSST